MPVEQQRDLQARSIDREELPAPPGVKQKQLSGGEFVPPFLLSELQNSTLNILDGEVVDVFRTEVGAAQQFRPVD